MTKKSKTNKPQKAVTPPGKPLLTVNERADLLMRLTPENRRKFYRLVDFLLEIEGKAPLTATPEPEDADRYFRRIASTPITDYAYHLHDLCTYYVN